MNTPRTTWSLPIISLVFLTSLIAHSATSAHHQEKEPLPSPWRLEAEAAKHGNYLPRYLALVRREKEYRASDRVSSYLQARGEVASYLGDVEEASRLFDEVRGEGRRIVKQRDPSPLEGYKPVDAETVLLKAADTHRVLMLNEGHHLPQTRVLTTRLLKGLYKKGFRYLALETLEGSGIPSPRQYPTVDSGFYTNEPVFGDLARQALEIGYTLIPYEFDGEPQANETMIGRMNRREIEQARNLKIRVFDKDPKAKLLVHAGISHISEQPQLIPDEKEPWIFMAVRFKELTGIDPFTIDQQTMIPHSRPEAQLAIYQDAVHQGWVTNRAVVFTDKVGKAWSQPSEGMNVDAQVFLPPVRMVQGRPDWLTRDLNRVAVTIPPMLRQGSGTRLVQAFFDGEPGNAVPIDQVLLRTGKTAPVLMLPRRNGKRFWLRTWDKTGKVIATAKVKL